jgi:hypothetical protein
MPTRPSFTIMAGTDRRCPPGRQVVPVTPGGRGARGERRVLSWVVVPCLRCDHLLKNHNALALSVPIAGRVLLNACQKALQLLSPMFNCHRIHLILLKCGPAFYTSYGERGSLWAKL